MKRKTCKTLGVLIGVLMLWAPLAAENIDPEGYGAQWAYGENVGWFNFEPTSGPGVTVTDTDVSGYVWAENIGWVNMSPTYGGVNNDGAGNLSGYAWAENVGWINFDPTYGGVVIDPDGYVDGWAYGENIGWIKFDSAQPYNVRVCTVGLIDLSTFITYWLSGGANPANLDHVGLVDLNDFSILTSYWIGYCPDGWTL